MSYDTKKKLVGGIVYLPLWKMMDWKSVRIFVFPRYGKMFQTTNQKNFIVWLTDVNWC